MRDRQPPVDDLWPRALGIPAFGIIIPLVFDLYGPLTPSVPLWWAGQLLFVALAAVIWHGNRHLLFVTAGRFDWLERPWLRVGRLLLGIVAFTAPLTALVIAGWLHFALDAPVEPTIVRGVVAMNVVCVVFVAHVYETVLLLKARQGDILRVANAERARAESELLALRRQIDPHFLFNCLNTLSALVQEDTGRALRFNQSLAAMLRYLLETGERVVVPLERELAFTRRYGELMALRFGDAFRLEIRGEAPALQVPPTSVQLLVENAVAHNRISSREPLAVVVQLDGSGVSVSHPLRPRPDSRGAGVGLKNLADRLRLAGHPALSIRDDDGRFTVRVALDAGATT